ncbi:hypothetical protein [Streptomyces malaysiensis]|uniref:hypothetical protein n=1 Tax=Streptomyces malaysiensis TaxID=92644 RepID=UPI00131B9798|nr:hypothetical protein [Streptomyces malaysiensis]
MSRFAQSVIIHGQRMNADDRFFSLFEFSVMHFEERGIFDSGDGETAMLQGP